MATILGFPTPQKALSVVNDWNHELAFFSKVLRDVSAKSFPIATAEVSHDLLLAAHFMLNTRRSWVHDKKKLEDSLVASRGKIEPGPLSVVRLANHDIVIATNGAIPDRLGDHWIFAEKRWEDLTVYWADQNYYKYFGYREDEVLGRRADITFGPQYGPQLVRHEESVQEEVRAIVFRELVSVRGTLVYRYAVRFPIFERESLNRLVEDTADLPFLHPIGIGCIAWADDLVMAKAL